jgi:Fe(3+) dicitrate transport protein
MYRLSITALLAAATLAAQQQPSTATESLAPVTVTGFGTRLSELPGSAAYVDAEDFRDKGLTNLATIAQQVPGVYVRDEDGYGNFPNLSLRGVDGTRSTKVTIMEDGILTAPSPYASPNAYYFPKAARMAGVEFLKGSSQVRFGPHTTGGVVNFLSTPIPEAATGYGRLTHGSHATTFGHLWMGGTESLGNGRLGTLVELHGHASDGYRVIDGTDADTGFRLLEPMVKLGWQPDARRAHRFELKVGMTDLRADETYLGLADADLAADPDRRYAGTAFDRHVSEQWRTYLKWVAEPDKGTRVESALYLNTFRRNWDKLDSLSGAGVPTKLDQALLDPTGLAVIQGLGAGNLVNRDAFRDHQALGWQTEGKFTLEGAVRQEVTVGLRVHRDTAGGTNQSITRASNGDGTFASPTFGSVTGAGYAEVNAVSLHAEDAIRLGALTLRPGIRQEWLAYANTTNAGVADNGDATLTTGGLGLTLDLAEGETLFAGIHAGASPANPAGYLAGTRAERSVGSELGWRRTAKAARWEVAFFQTDFRSLIAPEVGVGGGGLNPSRNAGSAESYGVEFLAGYDPGRARGWSVGTPLSLSATFTRARFKDLDGRLGNGAGLFAGAENGSEVPYVPAWKLGLSAGLEWARTAVTLSGGYSSSTWGTGYNERPRVDDTTGLPIAPSAVDGRIPSLLTLDLAFRHELAAGLRLAGGVLNLTDEREILSRAPLGPRANAPRTFHLGAEYRF